MITAEQKKKLKTVLKNGFPKEIRKNLTEKKILTRNGTPFTIGYILDVVKGKYSNYKIEEEIIELYQVKHEEIRLIHERRNKILGL